MLSGGPHAPRSAVRQHAVTSSKHAVAALNAVRAHGSDVYEAIVFDVDGVLVRRHADYPDVYQQAVVEAFAAFDVDPDASDVDALAAEPRHVIDGLDELPSVAGSN